LKGEPGLNRNDIGIESRNSDRIEFCRSQAGSNRKRQGDQ